MDNRSVKDWAEMYPIPTLQKLWVVWEYKVTDFRKVAQPHSVPKCVPC